MTTGVSEIIRSHCQPMQPRPTGMAPRLDVLPGIQAVLFDIYGTMLISAAGDISLQTGTSSEELLQTALLECGASVAKVREIPPGILKQTIAAHQDKKRTEGIGHPEVDIVAVWEDVLQQTGLADAGIDASRVALEYEVRVNPVWTMPGLHDCLQALQSRGLKLGIVSNAQAMTRQLFPALVDETLDELGFLPDLQFYSYLCGESKPGATMFNAAAKALAAHDLQPAQAVFVGNDMLNDVWAAEQAGMQTILFAGDKRSLRLREEDARMQGCQPGAVVTQLTSIPQCIA